MNKIMIDSNKYCLVNRIKELHLSYIFLFLFLTLTLHSKSQNSSISNYRYFCIKDTISGYNNDSIRFVMSGSPTSEKSIFFIQGSMPNPLFRRIENEEYCFFNSMVSDTILKKYNFVIISKPGVPLIMEDNTNMSQNQMDIFSNCNDKNYYINSIKMVYEYIKKMYNIKQNTFFIIGHSQGYGIVSKYASKYPNDFAKVVCMSSSIFNVPAIGINQIIENKKQGIYDADKAVSLIDSVYQKVEYTKEAVKYKDNPYYPLFRSDYSFYSELNYEYLLQIKVPLLVVYGLEDVKSLDNSLLPILFKSKNKSNLEVFCYPYYDHNFMISHKDKAGGVVIDEFGWTNVMKDVLNWMEK